MAGALLCLGELVCAQPMRDTRVHSGVAISAYLRIDGRTVSDTRPVSVSYASGRTGH